VRPPRAAVWLLGRALPGDARASIPGDLEEEYAVIALRSGWRAAVWYWAQALRLIVRFGAFVVWRAVRERVSRSPGTFRRRKDGSMATLLRDLRYAMRSLRRSPAFALTAILTLALGIGAATAVFSVVYGVLLKPFDYEDPDRLAVVWTASESFPQSWLSGPEFAFLRDNAPTISGGAVLWPEFYTLTGAGPAEQLRGGDVSPELFELLGVRAALGRTLQAGDDAGGERVVVLSDAFWRTRFGGERAVLGQALTLDGQPHTVVGVMPPDFVLWLPEDGLFHERPDLWLPLRLEDWQSRDNHSLLGLVRLRDGVGWDAFTSELASFAEAYRERNIGAVPGTFRFQPENLRADVVAETRPVLVALFGAVGFVLLLVCANVANLLLARAGERTGEMAVRSAVGAGRGALVRQLLAESLAISLLGGALGTLIGWSALSLMVRLAPPDLPRLTELTLAVPVLGFAALVSVLTAALFGVAPAIHASRASVGTLVRTGGRGASASRERMRHRSALVVGQFAFAFVLLISAVLLIRSLVALSRVDPGFTPDGVLTMQVRLPQQAYPDNRTRIDRFVLPATAELASLPGVRSAGVVSALPFTADFRGGSVWTERDDGTPIPMRPVDIRFADGGYFDAMSATLVAGRLFDSRDQAEASAGLIVDDVFAATAWPGQDPIGRRVAQDSGMAGVRQIIGVVRHINHYGLDEEPRVQLYFPAPVSMPPLMSFTIAFAGPPQPVADAARAAIQRIDPRLAVTRVTTMRQLVDASLSTGRFQTTLFTAFGAIALVLAAVGIYGVIAFGVNHRRREFGVRLALGATSGDVQRMVVGSGIRMAGLGLAIGLIGALLASRLLEQFLFGIRPTDLTVLLGVGFALGLVALLAAWLPARRAIRSGPLAALRSD
jgi:predicted permease